MTKIFSFVEFVVNFDSIIINLSSQRRYHTCLECDAQFSSISRFLAHTQKNCSKNFTCKHCEKIITSNNKFHKHVRLHHNKTLSQRFVEEENNHINLSISRFTFSITFKSMTASTKSSYLFIIMTKAQIARFIEFSIDSSITSTNLVVLIAFKSSHRHKHTCKFFTTSSSSFQTSVLLHFTFLQKITIMKSKFYYFNISSIISRSTSAILKSSHHSITMMNASIVCSSAFSSILFEISILSHITSKIYMIMKKLFEMFAKKQFKKK